MPIPADRLARRLSVRALAESVRVQAVRALAHLRAPETSPAPADRTARRV